MYDLFQEIGQNYSQYGSNTMTEYPKGSGKMIEQEVQGAAMMIENSTDESLHSLVIVVLISRNHFNFATQAERSNGSAMKPIAVYGPAMEEGLIQPGTPIADVFYQVPSGGGST